jgi:hypothetical protein
MTISAAGWRAEVDVPHDKASCERPDPQVAGSQVNVRGMAEDVESHISFLKQSEMPHWTAVSCAFGDGLAVKALTLGALPFIAVRGEHFPDMARVRTLRNDSGAVAMRFARLSAIISSVEALLVIRPPSL